MKTTPIVERVRVEQVPDGRLLGERSPRVSWTLDAGDSEFTQQRFEAELTIGGSTSSKMVASAESVLVDWPFAPLASRDEGSLRVRSESDSGTWTPWSAPCSVLAGFLEASDWAARFVSPRTLGGLGAGAPHIFGLFELAERPTSARLYISAHGIYEPYINGKRVGDDVFAPGWTAYEKRLRYQSYDVAALLAQGSNSVGAILGNGWYRGQLVWPGNRSSYGEKLALLAQLEMVFADGSSVVVASDESWRASSTGYLFDDFYDGETRDLRLSNRADVSRAEPVDVVEADLSRLVARRGPSVRITERVPAVSFRRAPSGRLQIDFGQNLAGWVELVIRGRAPGDEVIVRHAEVLEADELALRPLRSAKATATYLLAGDDRETLRPTFTYHGFRYADVLGLDEADILSATAVVVGTDLERIGWLSTSDDRLNRLHQNVVWGARGNFLDLPTDCPQRDERLGWTGDIQLFAPTANYLFDTSGFLAGWLEDLAVEQFDDGSVPFIVPDVLRDGQAVATGWGDAAVIVPMSLLLGFDDRAVVERQYPSMRAWVDKISTLADKDQTWSAHGQFGDWLDPTAPPDAPAEAQADQAVVATAYYARSAALVAEAAALLGLDKDADTYAALAARIQRGFEQRFVAADGTVQSDCQTVYALALCGNLISDSVTRARAGERLVALVINAGYTVATGLLGTAVILDALVEAGRVDVAFRMLMENEMPSWLYAVDMGATTLWERWDSMLPDGTVNPGTMTSFNHYANGAVADWMHRVIGGIVPLAPGYRRFAVKPLTCAFLDHSSARHRSPYGMISVNWIRVDATVTLEISVPYGTEAEVWVPGEAHARRVGPGQYSWVGTIALEK